MKIQDIFTLVLLFSVANTVMAQKKDENIGTEVVNVVKPYAPTISDAFKIKETAVIDDEETLKKEEIQYHIFSFPVASTFTPAKGKAANVDKSAKEKMFKNYATLALGNYTTINAELFVTEDVNATDFVAGKFQHLSSQGNIKKVLLDDHYFDTSIDLLYGSKQKNMSWKAELGYQNQVYNWYGLPEYFGNDLLPADRSEMISAINPQQTYHGLYISGNLALNDSFFDQATVRYDRFWDAYASEENRLKIQPKFVFDVSDYQINTNFSLDYLNTKFENSFPKDLENIPSDQLGMENSYLMLSAQPNLQLNKEDLTVNLGAEITFLSTLKNKIYGLDGDTKSDIYIYPKVTASYKLVGDLMIAYAGAEGGLQQNSYKQLIAQNPFLSPTQIIAPTDAQYDLYLGLRGKLSDEVSYNVKGSYLSEKNKVLFSINDYSQELSNPNYLFGNSFQVVYDDVKTTSFYGEIKADLNKNISFGLNANFNSYSTKNQSEAWNLPQLRAGAILDVTFTPKWYAGVNVFFVGERMDYQKDQSFTIIGQDQKTLDGYFDANFNLGYKYNERLTAFLKANNIANQSYARWLNFPVQQFQVMLGANYKFDF